VALPAKYISRALETKLERDGDAALTAAEWHLLMVGRFLLAVDAVCLLQFAFEQGESWKPAS